MFPLKLEIEFSAVSSPTSTVKLHLNCIFISNMSALGQILAEVTSVLNILSAYNAVCCGVMTYSWNHFVNM